MSKKRKDSFMKGWHFIQRTGRVESHFDVFNKTREFELADGRPRLIWSPHPSLKASLGQLNRVALSKLKTFPGMMIGKTL